VEMSVGIFFMRHLGSKRRYTFYPEAIGCLVTLRVGDYGWHYRTETIGRRIRPQRTGLVKLFSNNLQHYTI